VWAKRRRCPKKIAGENGNSRPELSKIKIENEKQTRPAEIKSKMDEDNGRLMKKKYSRPNISLTDNRLYDLHFYIRPTFIFSFHLSFGF